jgi:hypothetical protein
MIDSRSIGPVPDWPISTAGPPKSVRANQVRLGWAGHSAGPEVGPEWVAVTPSAEIAGVRVFLRWHLNGPRARCWHPPVRTCGGGCAISSGAPGPT